MGYSLEIQYNFPIFLLHKSHNVPVPYLTIYHFVTEMCTLSVKNGALWDMCLLQCGICEMTQFWRFIGPLGEILQGSCFRKLQAHEKIFNSIAWWWAGGLRKLSRWGWQRLIKRQCPRGWGGGGGGGILIMWGWSVGSAKKYWYQTPLFQGAGEKYRPPFKFLK